MANTVEITTTGKDAGAVDLLEKIDKTIDDVEKSLEDLGSKALGFETDDAEEDVRRLIKEFVRLEKQFERASKAVDLARARNELKRTKTSAKALANAEADLAAKGKLLVKFSKELPPELRKTAAGMDAVEKQTEQAAAAFKKFDASQRATAKSSKSLVGTLGQLRTGLAALLAGLGIAQLTRFGRGLIQVAADAVEVKTKFDALLPSLRAFTGSTELAEEVSDKLAATASKLKVPLAGLIDPFLGVSAGGKEAGLSIGEINELFESTLVSARAFGKGGQSVELALKGISDTAGKGVASMEEFRRQIAEQIPNAIPALAKGLGVTVPEAMKQVSSGALASGKALRALTVGFKALNDEAGLAQLDTLKGDLGGFTVAVENAQKALADGFAPGLRSAIAGILEFADGNEELIRSIGGLGGAFLEEAGNLGQFLGVLKDISTASEPLGERFRLFADGLGQAVSTTTGFTALGTAISGVGDAFTGVTAEARESFKAIEDSARRTVRGSVESAEDIGKAFGEAFREQAEAAEIAAKDIEATEKQLADRLGKLFDESAEAREALEKLRIDARRATGAELAEIENEIRNQLVAIEEKLLADQVQLQKDLLEETKKAAAERIAVEAKAQAEREKLLDGIVAKAKEVAAQRVATDAEAADKIEQIERKLAEDILKAREKADENLGKRAADRVKIAEDLTEKIVALERKAGEAIRAEQDRIAKAAEARGARERKEEEKTQALRKKSIEQLRELVAELEKVASGEDGEGSGFKRTAEDVDDVSRSVEELQAKLDLLRDPGTLGEDPLEILRLGAEKMEAQLGQTGRSVDRFADSLGETGTAARETARNFDEELVDAIDKARQATAGLDQTTRDAVASVLERYAELAGGGQTTQQDVESFVEELKATFAELGIALDDPVAALKEKIAELREAQGAVGEAAEESGEKQKDALGGAGEAAEDASVKIEKVGDSYKVTNKAAEETSVAVEKVGDAFKVTNKEAEETSITVEKIGDSFKVTQEAIEDTADATEDAADGLKGIAEAAEEIPEEIVKPEQPDLIRDLGTAATEAADGILPLADPIVAIAAGVERISEALPALAKNLPTVQESVAGILTALAENPVDLELLATSTERLSTALTDIGLAIVPIRTFIESAPDLIKSLQETLEPFFELVLQVADDDRFGRIGVSLASIAASIAAIPEPLEKTVKLFKDLVEQRDDLTEVLDAIAAGLAKISSEELLGQLAQLNEKLTETLDLFEKIKGELGAVNKEFADLLELIGRSKVAFEGLATTLRDQVIPGFKDTGTAADELTKQLKATTDQATELANRLQEIVEKKDGLDAVAQSIAAIGAAAETATEKVKNLGEALDNVDVP